MQRYDTLSQATQALKKEGYSTNFQLQAEGVYAASDSLKIKPADFEIDEVHRFEGMSNPADTSVIYAISSEKYALKGLLIDAYGVYANPLTTEMIRKLHYSPTS